MSTSVTVGFRASFGTVLQIGGFRGMSKISCFNTVEAYEDIYGKHSKTVKGEFYTILGNRPGRPASIFTEQFTVLYNESDGSDETRHGFLRRVMNPSFAPAALKSLEPTVERYGNRLVVGVEQKALQNEINKWITLHLTYSPLLSSLIVGCGNVGHGRGVQQS
jgi:hypothetical protein